VGDEANDDSHAADEPDGPSLDWLGGDGGLLPTLAEIWATVDLERALNGAPIGGDVTDDPLLGARVAIVSGGAGGDGGDGGDGAPVAVAEPSTEGRLAATLARHGEGIVGRYLQSPVNLDTVRVLAAAAGVAISRPAEGPFGRSVLLVTALGAGPHLILVDTPAARPEPVAPADPTAALPDRAAVPSPP
jgi:hypothetical protein